MDSSTAKLPKGQSYPLKPTALEAALSAAGIEIATSLQRSPGKLFDAHFWPRNQNVPYERLYIRAGSVPATEAVDARQRIESVTLPRLVRWIGEILAQDRNSPVRREKHTIKL